MRRDPRRARIRAGLWLLAGVGVVALLTAMSPGAPWKPAKPRRPTRLAVVSVTTSSIRLGWRDNSATETGFRVRYRAAGAASWRAVRLPGNTAGWTHSGLTAGATVSYQVRACNGAGCSAWTREVRGTTEAGPPPDFTGAPTIGGCPIFPADNPWNRDASQDPADPDSDAYVASISAFGDEFLHADFGSNPDYGIPYVVVPEAQAFVPVTFTEYGDESDPGPYPVPPAAPVEAGSDRHVLVLQQGACKLYELYHAEELGPGWAAGSGAVFDLRSNALRPDAWTSADAAGLPILPGLVRYDEVQAGEIRHALRFTVASAQRAFIHPATHYGSSDDPSDPPMGLRLRLKASYALSGFHGQARVVLDALQRYGMIVADQGTSWFITGETDPRWDDEDLDQLKTVPGNAFEVVESGLILYP